MQQKIPPRNKPVTDNKGQKKKTAKPGVSTVLSPMDQFNNMLKDYPAVGRKKPTDTHQKETDTTEPKVFYGPALLIGPRLENGDFYATPDESSEPSHGQQPTVAPSAAPEKPKSDNVAKGREPDSPSVPEQEVRQIRLPAREEKTVEPQEDEESPNEPLASEQQPEAHPVTGEPLPVKAQEQTVLMAGANINLAAGLLSLESLSGVRDIMRLYRTGRMFEYGTVSLDDLAASELIAAADHRDIADLPVVDRRQDEWHSFVQVYGVQGQRGYAPGLQGVAYTGYGLSTGVFSQLSESWIVGIMLGTQKVSGRFSDRTGSGSVNSIRLGPFFSWSDNDWHLDLAFTMARNEYEINRSIGEGGLSSRFNGMEWSAYGTLGYDISFDHRVLGLTLSPVLEVLYTRSEQSGYKEKGSAGPSMRVGKQSSSQWLTRMGLEMEYLLPDILHPTSWHFTLGWQQQSLQARSVSYEIPAFNTSGAFKAPVFNDRGLFFGIGYTHRQSGRSNINIRYHGLLSGRTRGHGLQLEYEMKF